MADVLFCTLGYPPEPAGGAEQQARLQAQALTRRGHRVTVVSRSPGASRAEVVDGITVHRLAASDRAPARLAYYARLARYLDREVRRFDVVHVHNANVQAELAVAAADRARRPVYLKIAGGGSASEISGLRGIRGWTSPRALRRAAVVQATTDEIADSLRGLGVAAERIATIPNGIDLATFRPAGAEERAALRRRLGLPADATIVLYQGRFAIGKGTADLLAAWRSMPDLEGAVLVLVGQGAARNGVHPSPSEHMIVRPWTADPSAFVRAADLFVLPSHGEGMSNALLESLASGVPAIVTPVGASASLVEGSDAGLVVPVGDRRALATAIAALLRDPARRGAMAARAPSAVAALDIDTVAARIDEVYGRIIDARIVDGHVAGPEGRRV
jgi:glycosyltransferase involved in cell wall biosynthesis